MNMSTRITMRCTHSAAVIVLCTIMFSSCTTNAPNVMTVTSSPYGTTSDGAAVQLFTVSNGTSTVKITTYGAAVTELWVPDRNGSVVDVVLGFDSLAGYLGANPYFGCTAGRYANRIAKGKFILDGKKHQLTINDGVNHLHGGVKGFDKVVWSAEAVEGKESAGVRLTYVSPGGEQGYPGTLTATVTYVLTSDHRLKVSFTATTDAPTLVNLTHHSYFNLAGAGSVDILGHRLQLFASRYTPVDATLIPTGSVDSVKGGPMDFLTSTSIGSRIASVPGGYDHNWVLDRTGPGLIRAVRLEEESSGRAMEVWTTEPAIQFYSGNFLDGTITGKGGKVYQKYFGLCLEPQHSPDSPNRLDWPSTVLRPGETYRHETEYRFSTF